MQKKSSISASGGQKSSTSGSGGRGSSGTSLSVNAPPKKTREIKAEQSMAGNSNVSSPDNNNYGGPQQAYKYQSLVETPSSPELANHRGGGRRSKTPGTPATPPGTPEIIQVGFDKSLWPEVPNLVQ